MVYKYPEFHTLIDIILIKNELIEQVLYLIRYFWFLDSDKCPIPRFKSSIMITGRNKAYRDIHTKIIPKKGTLSHNVGKAACRNYEIFLWDQNNKVKRKLENLLDMVSRAPHGGSSFLRARICKRLWSPAIDSEESISPGWESIPGFL
jgi:hypothetical protein